MRLGFDVDGVIYSWVGMVRKILDQQYGLKLGESTHWNYLKENTPPEVWKDLWKVWIKEMYVDGEFYVGAKATVKHLSRRHDIFLITAAPERVREARMQHLASHFPYISGIVFIPVLSSDKTFVQCDLYLDDKVETTINSAKVATSLLMDQPWNRETTPPGVIRVKSWADVVREVDKVEEALNEPRHRG